MVDELPRRRNARLVLLDTRGRILGTTSAVTLSEPWLQEIRELVETALERWGTEIAILRLLTADDARPAINVCYLAQLAHDQTPLPELSPPDSAIDISANAAFRLPYAEPGGPAADLAWAAEAIEQSGLGKLHRTVQHRTWNLSSIWQLDVLNSDAVTTAWLKHVPPFFGHEATVINLFSEESVPSLLAADGNRFLMDDIPGADTYEATLDQKLLMIERLVDLQHRWGTRVDELTKAGLPDLRSGKLASFIIPALQTSLPDLNADDQQILKRFMNSLPDRLSALDECGLRQTLVHGDYHPGNWRGTGNNLTILDWGDCFVGHPLLDIPGLTERSGTAELPVLTEHWLACWRRRLPDADIAAAHTLIEPVATAKFAATYQMFLDNIETSEHIYHESDPALWFHNTAEILRREETP